MKKAWARSDDMHAEWLSRIALSILSILTAVYALFAISEKLLPPLQVGVLLFGGCLLLALSVAYANASSHRQTIVVVAAHATYAIVALSTLSNELLLPWILLSLVSVLQHRGRGLLLSGLGFGVVAIGYALMTESYYGEYIVTIGGVISALYLMHALLQLKDREHEALVSARQHEIMRKNQLQTLINSINFGILTVSSGGTIRTYNASTMALLDTNRDLSGHALDSIFHLRDELDKPFQLKPYLESITRLTERDDLSLIGADGQETRLSMSINPIRAAYKSHAKNQGYIIIIRDITKSKTLDEERDEFISVVAHELRTPIAISEGSLSNVKFLLAKGQDPRVLADSIDEAHKQMLYLANMVNDLSTLSRAERGVGDEVEEIDVDALLHDLYARYGSSAEEKGLTLNLDIKGRLGTISTSRLYLEEMLQNFITNAIKYTAVGSVTVIASGDENNVHIAVRDTGIGISRSDQQHIFEKFYRSEDYRTRESSGTGLGLYVAQKLSRKLGITIHVASRLNHGSTFSFDIDRESRLT